MGTINVHFVGICTHITLPEPAGRASHRAVMVHGETGMFLLDLWIPPHRTFLMFDPTTLIAADTVALPTMALQPDGNWQLLGTRLSVRNAVTGEVHYDESMKNIPSLTKLTPDFGALSQQVVFGADAAAHFDVASGRFSAGQLAGGSWYVSLHVDTTSEHVELALQDLGVAATGMLTFRSGSTIVISNTGGSLFDKAWDFLLHYKTAQVMPPDPRWPGESPLLDFELLGPGCSNSTYP